MLCRCGRAGDCGVANAGFLQFNINKFALVLPQLHIWLNLNVSTSFKITVTISSGIQKGMSTEQTQTTTMPGTASSKLFLPSAQTTDNIFDTICLSHDTRTHTAFVTRCHSRFQKVVKLWNSLTYRSGHINSTMHRMIVVFHKISVQNHRRKFAYIALSHKIWLALQFVRIFLFVGWTVGSRRSIHRQRRQRRRQRRNFDSHKWADTHTHIEMVTETHTSNTQTGQLIINQTISNGNTMWLRCRFHSIQLSSILLTIT